MQRFEFDLALRRLSAIAREPVNVHEARRRTVYADELWRRFNIVEAERWNQAVARLIDTAKHGRMPLPSDFAMVLSDSRGSGVANTDPLAWCNEHVPAHAIGTCPASLSVATREESDVAMEDEAPAIETQNLPPTDDDFPL